MYGTGLGERCYQVSRLFVHGDHLEIRPATAQMRSESGRPRQGRVDYQQVDRKRYFLEQRLGRGNAAGRPGFIPCPVQGLSEPERESQIVVNEQNRFHNVRIEPSVVAEIRAAIDTPESFSIVIMYL